MYDIVERSIYDGKQSALQLVGARVHASWQTSCAPGPQGAAEYFTRIYVAFHAANTAVV